MNALASWLAGRIREHVAETRTTDSRSEGRLIFHGPPLEILRLVHDNLCVDRGVALTDLPILLQIPKLDAGVSNPPIGNSGICDQSHLLALRNSPLTSSYLALVPPGQHASRSVSSTTDEFGVAESQNGGNVPFEDWLADPFVQRVREEAIALLPKDLQDDASKLLKRALRNVDDVDELKASRTAAWRLLSRMFSVGDSKEPAAHQVSLACGVPPMETGKLSADEQQSALDGVANALSAGFQSGLIGAQSVATPEQNEWLESFLAHIRATCDVLTALERAPEPYYAPSLGLTLTDAPDWWLGLTAELWSDLLDDEPEVLGDIVLECRQPILPYSKGIPLLVRNAVDLSLQVQSGDGSAVALTLERTPGKNKDGFPISLLVDGEEQFQDPAPPNHKAPLNYKARAEQFKPASIKVVSLAHWEPGIFVACRQARKISSPRAPARKNKEAQWETNILLPGPGRFELLVFLRPGSLVGDIAAGLSSSGGSNGQEQQDWPVHKIEDDEFQIEVEAEGAYQLDIPFQRADKNGKVVDEVCRVFLQCDDEAEEGCRSEFERLIKLNRSQLERNSSKPLVQLNRSARSSSLQGWLLLEEHVAQSFLPLVLADDYGDHWVQPKWNEEWGRILSRGRYLKDPRPPASEFVPPPAYIEARQHIAAAVRKHDEQSGLLEGAPLGEWLRKDEKFPALIETYLDAYMAWLKGTPEVASWADVTVIATLESDRHSLARSPDAILLSPLHPLRLAWHSVAQKILHDSAISDRPCPAAGILDPKMIPDFLRLPIRSPEGIEWTPFLSVESNSDYWSVLWNGSKLRDVPKRSQRPPFDQAFGLSVGGISTGFSASQVKRALDDVSNVLCAKPTISVVVSSTGGTTDSCNDGLIEWSSDSYSDDDRAARLQAAGQRRLNVFDIRNEVSRPDDATIANLSDDTGNSVRWFVTDPKGTSVDLGIIAQLDSSEPETISTPLKSPLGAGGLLRHRIRRQIPGSFLSESRQASPAASTGDALADKVAACLAAIENSGETTQGLRFAPNLNAISEMLEEKAADFVAISSSAVDPACFLGGWFQQTYLWDYDLPSYSQRAGDTNGYYVLSKVKPSDRDGMRKVLSRLPGCETLDDDRIGNILLEVARRGIPTIRGLSGDDTGATGDLGLFVAARLLQDRFRLKDSALSLLPVIGSHDEQPVIGLVIPVDPFRGYLDDLSRVLNRDIADASLARPDLMVVAIVVGASLVQIHITPVEVKSRMGSVFPKSDADDALGQAKALAKLFAKLSESKDPLSTWRLAYKHLLLSIIGFGMRVYSQHQDLAGDPGEWAGYHERIATAILGDEDCVSVDQRGRLIIVDDTAISGPKDHDGDGFDETIAIGRVDAGRIVALDAQVFYDSVTAKVGDWEFTRWPKKGTQSGATEGDTGPENPKSSASGVTPVPAAHAEEQHEPPKDKNPTPASGPSGTAAVEGGEGIKLAVGRADRAFEPKNIDLAISDTRLNQLNMGVVGDLGTGKTQLLKSLVYQIVSSTEENRGIRPRIMVFDYKRDYSSADFVEATGARVVRPHRLPLNLFDTSSMEDTTVPWLDRFRFFADVLDKIYSGIGPVQRDKLKRAVKTAYEGKAGTGMPTIYDVHEAYAELLEGKSDTPMAIIDDLVDMEIFERDPAKTLAFNDFLDGVVVISLDALGQDDRSKNMLVAVMLNMFYENMLRTPKRPFLGTDPQLRAVDSYLLVDEADNIMRYEFDVLRKLLLQGREFGCGVILASQYLRHFKVNATDYREPLLTWFVHKVPNVTPTELSALGLATAAAEMAERVKTLPNHHCLFKSYDTPGQIIRGLPFYELIASRKESKS